MIDPEGRWDVWGPPMVELSAGPDSTLCDNPPRELPRSRSAGFTADLTVRGARRAGEQTDQ